MLQNNRKTWKAIAVTAVGALSISLLAACGSNDEGGGSTSFNNSIEGDTSSVVVKYKGGEITEKEFNSELKIMEFMNPTIAAYLQMDEMREMFVKQQVAYEYLSKDVSQEAGEKGLEEAEAQLTQMKTQVGGDEAWKQMLTDYEVTEDELKNYMTRVLSLVEYKSQDVTDEQAKTEYEANKDQFITASVRHVLISNTDPESGKLARKGKLLNLRRKSKPS